MANPNPDMTGLRRTGRPKGSRNRATVAREAAATTAMIQISKGLASREIANADPVELMLMAMRAYMALGQIDAAVSVAAMVAPYTNSRRAPIAGEDGVLPPELQPDPVPTPDEPGPANPI